MTEKSAQALWIVAAGKAECRPVPVDASQDEVMIDSLFSAISRGTERLVFNGDVPDSVHATMRAPFQEGEFGFPVKYGYAAVGTVKSGDRAGQIIFALHPHQTRFAVPSAAAVPVPEGVPPERAILAANMETALNITWDAGVAPGDKVAVVGAGVVGALTGYISARIPGTDVCLIDIDEGKAALAKAMGCGFATPVQAQGDADVVIHASATSAGLATAIRLAGMEAAIVEASWFGTERPEVPLGGAFHQRRLRIVGSQVGRIPAERQARWTFQRRMRKALDLLIDPVLDALISGETEFTEIAEAYGAILNDPETLCHRIRYVAAGS